MKLIKIVSDSTVQLSKEEQEKYEITIISFLSMIEEELYYDYLTAKNR
ncbi:DegV family protein [Carnobacterium mobile]|nr:DegV family protein [Carnobacterium mobile]